MRRVIVTTLYLLSILIPLVLSPVSFELFEFPKFILLLTGTLVITIAWAIHLYRTRDYSIIPTTGKFASYAVLAILATQALATIFSLHPYTSFWGYYSRFHGGLLTTICYTIIYFAATKWLDTKSTHKLIKISVGTAFIISLYAILERLGIDKNFWIQDVQNRVFSTLGQPNWLAAYLLPNLFLSLYLAQRNNKHSLYSLFLFSVLLIALIFTKSRSGFLAFVLSYATYWFLLARQFSIAKIKSNLVRYSIFLFFVLLLFGTPYTPSLSSLINRSQQLPSPTPQGTALETGGTESGDIRKIVWTGALHLIAKHPVLGTGPETFAYTYYNERPLAHNLTSEWDFLYNKAHNEYLNIAAGSGIVGLLAYLAFHLAILSRSLAIIPKSKKINQTNDDHLRYLAPVLGASIVGFTITNFFGFSVIPVYLLMILLSALPTAIHNSPTNPSPKFAIDYWLLIIILPLIYPARLFYADYLFARGKAQLDAGNLSLAVPLLERAVESRPSLDLFHSYLGEAYASTTYSLSQSEDDAAKAQVHNYLPLALAQVDQSRALNPWHLNYHKSRAKVYLTLALIDPKYNLSASQELESARILAPTDPKLAYNLGLIYTRLNDLSNAESQLKEAITLKPNYADPYYALTLLYEQTKQTAKIPELLGSAKTNLATYSAQLKDKIEKYSP